MILKHSEIEEFRKDPKSYLKKIKDKKKQNYFTKSAYRTLQLSAFHYHKKNSAKEAQRYLITSFQKFKNKKNLVTLESQLKNYIQEFIKSGNSVVKCMDRINEMVGNDIYLKGEINRLDRKKNGLPVVYLFQKELNPDWKKELRFPILQNLYSKMLNVNADEVSVGIYAFDKSEYDEVKFGKIKLKSAEDEFRVLVELLEGL